MAEEEIAQGAEGEEGAQGAEQPDKAVEQVVVVPPVPVIEEEIKVPVRSNYQHIIARKNQQIEKLKAKKEEDGGYEDGGEQGYEDDDNKPLTKGDLKPLFDTLANDANENELKSLFEIAPEAKKYEKAIRLYMEHPAWKAVPPQAIYHHLAFSATAKEQAKAKAKEIADKEAAQMAGAGSGTREAPKGANGLPSAEEIANMSDAEIEALASKARQGKFVAK